MDKIRRVTVARAKPNLHRNEPDGTAERRKARCYACGHEGPWSRRVDDLRRARCAACGGLGAALVMARC